MIAGATVVVMSWFIFGGADSGVVAAHEDDGSNEPVEPVGAAASWFPQPFPESTGGSGNAVADLKAIMQMAASADAGRALRRLEEEAHEIADDEQERAVELLETVSYTHLTLPTKA